MPQFFQPVETKVVTKDGECKLNIALEITVNLNTTGITVAATGQAVKPEPEKPADKSPEENVWAIPDFKPKERFQFGK